MFCVVVVVVTFVSQQKMSMYIPGIVTTLLSIISSLCFITTEFERNVLLNKNKNCHDNI